MKKSPLLVALPLVLFAALVSLPALRAANPVVPHNSSLPAAPVSSAEARDILTQEINSAALFYRYLQQDPRTEVPDWVAILAKGVIIFDRWNGGVVIGGTGGEGIGLLKMPNGRFSPPAFYHLGGVSFGFQLGASHVRFVAFLMSAKALQTLTDNRTNWAEDARVILGDSTGANYSPHTSADIIIYEQSSGLDLGAAIADTTVSAAHDNNRTFYAIPDLTPQDILTGKVPVPDVARPLIRALNQRAALTTDQYNSPD